MDATLEVIVIGGGFGHQLAHQRRRFTIFDAGDSPAATWRSRWDSLTPERADQRLEARARARERTALIASFGAREKDFDGRCVIVVQAALKAPSHAKPL